MLCVEDDDFVDYCAACKRAIYRWQEAVYIEGEWYCDTACLVDGIGAEWGPVEEILDKVAAR